MDNVHWRNALITPNRIQDKAFLYICNTNEIDYEKIEDLLDMDDPGKEIVVIQDWLDRKFATKDGFKVEPIRGDFIQLDWFQYRNDGLYMIDKNPQGKLIVCDLCYRIDTYGSLPPQFTIEEFPILYFNSIIGHNSYVWVPTKYDNEIKANMLYGPITQFYNNDLPNNSTRNESFPYSHFTCNGKVITVIAISECNKPNPLSRKNLHVAKFQSYDNGLRHIFEPIDPEYERTWDMFLCTDPIESSDRYLLNPDSTIFIWLDCWVQEQENGKGSQN